MGNNIRVLCRGVIVIGIWNGFSAFATVYHSDGSSASVQGLHNAALNGDTITIPAGSFTWSTPVTISKAIKLQGGGSGRIIGKTKTSVATGTGSKTFTTTHVIPGVSAGQVLRISKMPQHNGAARENYMEGTVTSYSGTTLVLNVTNTGGSGTYRFWFISTPSATTINSTYTGGSIINVQQPNTGSVEISGLRIVNLGSTTGNLSISATTYSGPKTIIHDCWFENSNVGDAIRTSTNRGLVYNCSFDDVFSQNASAFHMKMEGAEMEPSWSTASTMGADDTNGATNFYIEDCDFHAYLIFADFDSNARVVFRHNFIDNAGGGSHGADSNGLGMRHAEIYDNTMEFDAFPCDGGNDTLNVNWFWWVRGGTWVFTDNVIPNIDSCSYPNRGNILFSVVNLTRSIGCYPCWTTYPAPHQPGQGFVANNAVRHNAPCNEENYGYYYISSEPIYIWNNTGSAGNRAGLNSEANQDCPTNQNLADYVQAGRDYILGAKPGYQKFTYPHPLRNGGSPTPTPSPTSTPSATISPTSTPTATPRATPTPTPTATVTPTPSLTPTPTPTPTPTASPSAGLVAAYSFNEGTGTTVHDASANGNTGALQGGASWTPSGKYGKAISFNGTNALVSISNSSSLQLTSAMTLEAWVNPSRLTGVWRDVIYKGRDNYYLEADSTSNKPATRCTSAAALFGTGALVANAWTHLAGTYDGATLRLYVNGVQVSSRAQTGAIATSTNPLQIGGDSIFGQYFAGRIDEVRVYSRALNATEIRSDMNIPIAP